MTSLSVTITVCIGVLALGCKDDGGSADSGGGNESTGAAEDTGAVTEDSAGDDDEAGTGDTGGSGTTGNDDMTTDSGGSSDTTGTGTDDTGTGTGGSTGTTGTTGGATTGTTGGGTTGTTGGSVSPNDYEACPGGPGDCDNVNTGEECLGAANTVCAEPCLGPGDCPTNPGGAAPQCVTVGSTPLCLIPCSNPVADCPHPGMGCYMLMGSDYCMG